MRKTSLFFGVGGDVSARSSLPERARRASITVVAVGALLAMAGRDEAAPAPPAEPGGVQAGSNEEQLRETMRRMIEQARDRVFPALVNIHVVTVNYWDGKEEKRSVVGSGTIISPEGYVVTNQHVTDRGRKFRCTLADRQEVSATLVGEDPLTDLAVLKLNLSELRGNTGETPVPQGLPFAGFGDSDDVRVGDQVMAMGSPFALSRSVTLGIVSNKERVFAQGLGDDLEEMELEGGQETGLFTRWIQHDAVIHPGNSGGPLVNLQGEIVGVNELGGGSIGFAIPSNLAQAVTAELIAEGEIVRSWIGISFKPIKKTGLDKGVLVNSIIKDGPAEKAGIQAGDVIVRLGDEPVTVRFAEEVPPLLKRIADLPVGSQIKLGYERAGASDVAQPPSAVYAEAIVTTAKLEKDRGRETALRGWGLSIQQITPRMARERRFESIEGVVVTSVRSGGPAQVAEPSIFGGDVIRAVDGEPVHDLAAMVERYEKIMEGEKDGGSSTTHPTLIEFDRRGKNQVTLIKSKPDEAEPPPREVRKAWIGVDTQPVLKKLAAKLGHADKLGYRISRVYPRTLAAESDLKVGDVIVALEGEKGGGSGTTHPTPLSPQGMQDAGLFAREVRKLSVGATAKLTVLRQGEIKEVDVKLEPSRETPAEVWREKNRDFELTVRDVTFFDRDDRRWGLDEEVQGVIVEQVEGAGWAGLGGIDSGDLIQKIQGREIRGVTDFREAMAEVAKAQPTRVVFVVLRGMQTRYQFVEPDWKPIVDGPGGESDAKTGQKTGKNEEE